MGSGYRSDGISHERLANLAMDASYKSLLPELKDIPYKGYLIRFNALRNEYWVEKNGSHISYAQTIPQAKKMIDELVD